MADAQERIARKGEEIFRLMAAERPSVFDRKRWAGELMAAAMEEPDLKVRLFRFIDVLPALTGTEAIARHVREYFLEGEVSLPPLVRTLLAGFESPLTAPVAAALVKRNIERFARTFIVGESPMGALKGLRKIWNERRTFTVDILGEAALSEREAARYLDLYLDLAARLAGETAGWDAHDPGHERHFPRLNVSVKLSSLFPRIGPVNYEESVEEGRERLRPVFRRVRELGGGVNLDMEMYSLKGITLDVFTSLLEEPEFAGWEDAGIALQAYLKETRGDLERLIAWAGEKKRRITVRLVKGAYWEYETITARQKGWSSPVFTEKGHTDWNFERCAELLLDHGDRVTLAVGSHNVRSLAAAMVAAEERRIPRERCEFQMLYGMAEPVKNALRRMGNVVREYAPMGELVPGMAYLVRRLLENTSNEGFLRKTFAAGASRDSLLAGPEPYREEPAPTPPAGIGPFRNEPPLDFARQENRRGVRDALVKVRGELGRSYPIVIGGEEIETGERIVSVNPADPAEKVGVVSSLDGGLAEKGVAAARAAQEGWGRLAPAERAALLFRAAEIARGRRFELLAWQVLETGKGWEEADADVVEAIDYLEYYGREALRLGEPRRMGDIPGEENRYLYRPRGVAVVIAPWNFPLAISAGMVAAALVAGNSVLYKPSSLSPVNGWQLFSLLREAGVPAGVLSFVPGGGAVVGESLVGHPEVDLIAFTGSREVGLAIVERAGKSAPGQRCVKRVVAEMGGKNAVIVDADADLDQAVAGVLRSAFGYQGQKCSACSRVIVLAECHDRFLERLVEAVKSMTVGPPEDPAFFMGPLIDEKGVAKVAECLALGRREGKVAAEIPVSAGCYVSPAVVSDLPADSRLLREEVFGPLLAVIRVRDLEEALRAANDSDYALTGGLFSRSPASIRRVTAEFEVGNLYVNRGITGAVVGRQPFGGFRLSGVGSKAGGPDYLMQFMEPRVVTENTMRRGFAPETV